MNLLRTHLHNLFSLVYPPLCYSCRIVEPLQNHRFCLSCLHELPFIVSAQDSAAALAGKQYFPHEVRFFQSLFYYTKDSRVADMIHSVKYEGQYRMAWYLGELLGKELSKTNAWNGYSLLPVPIHRKRYLTRGYNQSEEMAKGIAKTLHLPILSKVFVRTSFESSQTGKGRLLRSEVLKSSFVLKDHNCPDKILLIDDVVTTGSTINACVHALNEVRPKDIAVASVGISI